MAYEYRPIPYTFNYVSSPEKLLNRYISKYKLTHFKNPEINVYKEFLEKAHSKWGLLPLGYTHITDTQLLPGLATAWKYQNKPLNLIIFQASPRRGRITITMENPSLIPQPVYTLAHNGRLTLNPQANRTHQGFPVSSKEFRNREQFLDYLTEAHKSLFSRSDDTLLQGEALAKAWWGKNIPLEYASL